MDVLITDANIWIDLEVGGLTGPFFQLPADIVVPDVLYHAELADQHSYLLGFDLDLRTVDGPQVARAVQWGSKYPNASRNDLLALALADQLDGTLVTGDSALRNAADSEDVEVHGTIWVGDQLVDRDVADEEQLRTAYENMKNGDRRLPWGIVEDRLEEWGLDSLD